MYKKSLAVLLSVLLVATSLISLFSFSVSANSSNLVADGKFENGFSGWQVHNNSGNSSADFNVVEEGDNHVLSAIPGLSMFKQVQLEAGVEYTAGFDFKFDTNASVPATYDSFYRVGFTNSVAPIGGSIFVGPYASGNKYYNVYISQKNDPNNWKSHTFTFTPSSNMTTYFVVGSYNGQGEANFFVDNVFLAKTSDLVNVTTVAGDGGSVSGGIKTFKGDSVTVKALPSAGYELDGWYNAASEKLSSDLNYTFVANENVELTAKFKVSTYNPNLIVNGDFSEQNLDDFEVYKNGNNSSADFAFTAFGEDYILSAKAGHSLFKKVDLKGGTSYTMSFDFRFTSANVPSTYDSFYRAGFVSSVAAVGGSIFVGPNATGNKYYSIFTHQSIAPTTWKNHSFTFTPATDMSVWAVVGSYNHQGVADFELDNWMLYKTSDLITVTAVADEGGSANGTATVLNGKKVVLTATAEDGYEFLGWYNEDVLVSAEAEYAHIATENITLVAKFKSTAPISNYIVNGDFEQPFTTDAISNVNQTAVLGKWGKIYSGVARMEATETANFTSYDSAEKNGTRYITSGATKDANQYIRAFGQYVNLPAGEYVLEFDAKSNVSSVFVVSVKKGQNSIAANDLVYNHLDESLEWKHYKINFTADAEGLYQISFGGNTQGRGEGDFSIDNVSLEVYVEENPSYIVNGDFEKPFTTDKISDVSLTATTGKWGKIYSGVARMEATETANFTSYDSAELNGTRYITSGSTKDSNKYIRAFGQYVELPTGEFVLEFDAKSTIGDVFVASIKKGQNSINYSDDIIKYLKQSDEWTHYSIKFTADVAGLYQIAFGGNSGGGAEGDFSIDNVSLDVYVEENPNYIVNGDFETRFATDKISDVSLSAILGKWGRIYSGVARMEATETANFTSYDSAEKNGTRYITSGATKDDNQYIRAFGQYVNLPAGDFVLEFDAKSTASNMFVVSVKKGQDSIAANDLVYKHLDESLEWKHYTIRFNLAEEGLYQIAFGGNTQKKGAADFAIDNVGLFDAEGYVTVTADTDGGGKITYPIGNLEIGSTATVIATADAGYIFAGWYNGTELVSADASYTFTVTESVELKAKFDLNLGDDDAIVKNGRFDIGSTAGWTVKKNHTASATELVVDADTGSLVAHTTGNGAIAFMQKVNLKANTEYLISFDFKFDNFEAIPAEYSSFYRSGFLADPNGGLGNANFVGPNVESNNVYISLANIIVTDDKNAWNSISYTFTPATDMETWFVIGAYNEQGVSNYSIDNIAILPKKDVTGITLAVVNRGGSGKATSSKTGIVSPGEKVTLTATPNKGSAFGGWYINGVLISENAQHVYEITGNDVVYARFVDAANPNSNQMLDNSDFATGDLSGWGKNNISFANNTVEYVTESGESYVKLGESDMLYQPVEFEPYSTYMIRVTTRIPDIKEKSYQVHDLTFFRFGISEYNKPNVLQSGALEKDPYSYTSTLSGQCDCEQNDRFHCAMQWNTYTYTYSNNSPDTVLANVVIGTPYCKSDLHIKKFEFVKYVDGIVDFESDILYGEDFFNNVKNPSFEEKTTDADWGAKLPSGWTIKNEGKKGTNYLSVSGNESKTYTFKVRTGTTYVVAFSLRTKGVGYGSVSIVDDNGKPWGDSFNLVADTAVFSPKADGKWQRMGAHLYIADNVEGYANINIKITGGSNVLDIDEVTITKLGYATHAENPNVYTDNSFDYNNPRWYNPTLFYKLPDGTAVEGAVDDPYANKN